MFYEQRLTAPDSPAALRAEYDEQLREIVAAVGVDAAAADAAVDRSALEALVSGEPAALSLGDAAEIVALSEDEADAETIEIEACEHLLLGMSTAVLDVETLASHPAVDLEPKEIQQKIERRAPMSFAEFVSLQYAIAERSP